MHQIHLLHHGLHLLLERRWEHGLLLEMLCQAGDCLLHCIVGGSEVAKHQLCLSCREGRARIIILVIQTMKRMHPLFWRTKSGKAPENESSCTSKGTRELVCMVFGGREQSLLSGEKSGRVPEI